MIKRAFILYTFLAALIILPFEAHARDKFLDIQEITTEGGLTVWLVEDDSIPVISMDFAFKGAGSSNETAETQGTARLLSNTMDEGAGELTSEEFQKELRDLSIALGFGSSRDDFSGSVKTLTENKTRAFELLKMALNEPRFDADPVARMKAANQARIRSSLADPDWMAARILNDVAYSGHPYALNSGGTLSTLENITPENLRSFKDNHLTKDRLHIAVAGDITKDELTKIIDDVFGGLPETAPETKVENLSLQNIGKIFLLEKDIPQTVIEIIQTGINRKDPAFQHAQIMNFILGSSGFGSRLTEEIREKRGLTYGIYSYFSNMDYFDGLLVSSSTQSNNVRELLKLVEEEFAKLRSYPISEDELENAKSYLIGSLPLSLTSTDKISGLLLSIKMNNLGVDYLDKREEEIRNASVNDIFKVSQKILAPENFVTVLVGKPAGITPDVKIEKLPNVE